MTDSVGNCLEAYIEEFRGLTATATWAVLVPLSVLQDAHKSAAVLMPSEALCSGRSWLFPNGSKFIVASFNEEPCPAPSNILTCSDGRPFKSEEMERLKIWRSKK